MAELFARTNTDARYSYSVEVSFCQVYNETIDDLLRSAGQNLRLRQTEAGEWIVDGLSWHPCTTPEGIKQARPLSPNGVFIPFRTLWDL